MITVPYVKRRVLELIGAQKGTQGVALLYGHPEAAADTAGDDTLYRQMITFNDPDGGYDISEMCGPGVVTYDEDYSIELVVQVIARTRDTKFYDVEQQRAHLVHAVTRALQEPDLGHTATDDDRFTNLRVTLGTAIGVSGWLVGSGSNLAATRAVIDLDVAAVITGGAS